MLIKNSNINSNIIKFSEKNKKKLLNKSHLYICSSHFEGFPNAVVDAINYSIPIISSNNHGGIKEILSNGSGGELYKIGDVNQLKNKINKIRFFYKDSLTKTKFAKKKLNRFTKKNINKYEKLFDDVLVK